MTLSANERGDLLSVAQRLRWGLRWGLIYVVVFGGLAVVLRIVDGPQSFAKHSTSLEAFIEAYITAGVLGGVVLGLAKPWLRFVVVTAVVGAVIGAMIGSALLLTNGGLNGLSTFDLVLPGAFAVCACVVAIRLHGRAKQMGKI
jgi:integral membrane sensor domain MASE1